MLEQVLERLMRLVVRCITDWGQPWMGGNCCFENDRKWNSRCHTLIYLVMYHLALNAPPSENSSHHPRMTNHSFRCQDLWSPTNGCFYFFTTGLGVGACHNAVFTIQKHFRCWSQIMKVHLWKLTKLSRSMGNFFTHARNTITTRHMFLYKSSSDLFLPQLHRIEALEWKKN